MNLFSNRLLPRPVNDTRIETTTLDEGKSGGIARRPYDLDEGNVVVIIEDQLPYLS